jgi:hypothetical protein
MVDNKVQPDPIVRLYNNIKNEYDLPDFNTFKADMSDSNKAKRLHNTLVSDGYDVPEYDVFSVDMGLKKKVGGTESSPTGLPLQGFSQKQIDLLKTGAPKPVAAPVQKKEPVLGIPTNLPKQEALAYENELKLNDVAVNTLTDIYKKKGLKFDPSKPAAKKQIQEYVDKSINGDLTKVTGKDGKEYLVRSQGFFESAGDSFVRSLKDPIESTEINFTDSPEELANLLDEKIRKEPNVPQEAPSAVSGYLGGLAGGLPKLAAIAAIPYVGQTAMVGEMYYNALANQRRELYQRGLEEGMDRVSAAKKAMEVAPVSAIPDALVAAVMARGVGGKAGGSIIPNAAKESFIKAAGNALKSVGVVSATGGFTGYERSKIQQRAGYKVTDAEAIENGFREAGDYAIMDAAFKVAHIGPKYLSSAAKNVLSTVPKEILNVIAEKYPDGKRTLDEIPKFVETKAKVQDFVPEEKLASVTGLTEKTDNIKSEIKDLEENKKAVTPAIAKEIDLEIADKNKEVDFYDNQIKKVIKSKDETGILEEVDDVTGFKVGEGIVPAEVKKPSVEQQAKESIEGNIVTFTYKSEAEVPEVFKERVSSSGENTLPDGTIEKFVRVTVPKSLAEYELSKIEKPKTAKEEISVYHGGSIKDLATTEGGLFVSADKSQAESYAKGNKGQVQEFKLNKNDISNENNVREVINELGLKSKEEGWDLNDLMLHEIIDPRFETSLSEGDLNKLFKELDKRGYKAIEMMATDVSGKQRNVNDILILNPKETLKEVKPTEVKAIEDIEAKKADIEKERQTELDDLKKGIPAMITKKLESDLKKYGFTDAEINKMTPIVANEKLIDAKYKAKLSSLEGIKPEVKVTEEVKDLSKFSETELEKRQLEIEGSKSGTPENKEFNDIDKELEKREWRKVFDSPLDKVSEVADELIKKNQEQPNGFGSYIQSWDARSLKLIADKYSKENVKKITDSEIIKDYKDAMFGNPTSWYSDGLRLRESVKEAQNRGIDVFKELSKEFVKDGYSKQDAMDMAKRKLEPILKDLKQSSEKPLGLEQKPTEVEVTEEVKVTEKSKEEKTFAQKDLDRAEAKKIHSRVSEMDPPIDAEQIALRYLSEGGKVSQDAINEVSGTTKRASLNTGRRELKTAEAKARDYAEGKESLDDLAHRLWENSGQEVSERDIKNALMSEIGNNNTRLDASKAYLERYNIEYKEEQYYERFIEEEAEQHAKVQEELERDLRRPLEEETEGMSSEEHIDNLIKQYEAETKRENKQIRPEGKGEAVEEISSRDTGKKAPKEELAKDYKESVSKVSKKAKENAKKEFVDRNFDSIVEKLKIQIKCPT